MAGADAAAHLFHQRAGDGQAQAGGMVGGFDGEEAVEELGGGDAVEGGGMVGKGDDGVAGKADKEVAIAVFEGVVENVVKDTRQGVGVEGAPDSFVAEPNVRRQAALLKGAVETG